MKKFRIDENERERILNMHIEATQRQYLAEQTKNIQGTLKTAGKSPMIDGYSDLVKKITDDNQIFVVGNSEGVVSIAGNSSQLQGKQFRPNDSISMGENSSLVVYPKGLVDQQFMIEPRNGKLILFVGG